MIAKCIVRIVKKTVNLIYSKMEERKIKFRAWDGKRMTTSGIMFNTSTGCVEVPKSISFNPSGKDIDTYRLMQCTGLKDKNGKEIYEGDFVKNHQASVNEVHWYINGWHYRNFHAEALPLDDTYNPYQSEFTAHEIVGNIYENPELLKQL